MNHFAMHARDIGSWPRNVALARSTERGWRNIHAQHVAVQPWTGTLEPVGSPCLGYCVNRPAQLRRRIGRGTPTESGTLRPRQFHLIPAHDESEWHRRDLSEMLAMHLRQDLLDEAARRMWSSSAAQVELSVPLGTVDPLLEQLALVILRLLGDPPESSAAIYVDELVQAMASHLVRTYTADGRSSRVDPDRAGPDRLQMNRVRELIEDRLADELTLELLAREAGVSSRSLSRAFATQCGTSVHQFVLGRRLERAKQLLVATNLGIAEIAIETGFSSQSHLATAFRRVTGMTPKSFRVSQH